MNVDLYQPLLQILNAEHQAFSEFISLLEHESSVLQGQYTHEEIHHIATQKTAWHQQYTQLQNKRRKILQALELQDSAKALQDLAEHNPLIQEHLNSLLDSAAKAQELNHANGQLIQEYLNHHQHALNILHSLNPEQSAQTYDATGRRSQTGIGQRAQFKA